MDYYQGVVTEYLRADRAVFVNTECCIQLNPGENPDRTGPHWFCDAVAIDLRNQTVFLCEITYSKTLAALGKRLTNWAKHWNELRTALARDCCINPDWNVQPWVFIPEALKVPYDQRLSKIPDLGASPKHMPIPKVTTLEEVTPWKYASWNRHDEMKEADERSGEGKET
jgi:hypothetical protein